MCARSGGLSRFCEPLSGLAQLLPALQRLIDPLRQLVSTPFAGSVISGAEPTQLSLAEHVGLLADPIRSSVLIENRSNSPKAEACLTCYRP